MQLQLDGLHLMMCEVLTYLPLSSTVVTTSTLRSTANLALGADPGSVGDVC
jgi:hypothetical protein